MGPTVRATLSLILAVTLFPLAAIAANEKPPAPSAARLEELERRMKELEREFEDGREESSFSDRGVRSFLNTRLSLGGFSETGLVGLFQRDRSPQAAAASTSLGINIGAVFSDRLRFVSQLISGIVIPVANPHDDSRAPAAGLAARRGFGAYQLATLVTQAYGEWEGSDAFRVQGGVGYAPWGISFQQLELVLFVRRGGPQLLRSNNELVHPLWQGVHFHGAFPGPQVRWGYNAYTFSPATNTQKLGFGTRVWLESSRSALLVGLSQQTASRGDDTFTTVGPDLRLRLGRFTLTSELAKGYGKGPQSLGFHLEPDVDVYGQNVLLYVFGDYLESSQNRTGLGAASLADPFRKWEYGGGMNWLPTSFTRVRLGLAYNHYVGGYASNPGGRDYWLLDASAGVAF